MNNTELTKAMEQLQAEESVSVGWTVQNETVHTVEGDDPPTNQELEDAFSRWQTADTKQTAIDTERASMRENWESQPEWLRGPFDHVYTTVNKFLTLKDYDAALNRLENVKATEEILLNPTKLVQFNATQQAFIDAVEALRDLE